MLYSSNPTAIAIFVGFVGFVLGLSFYLGRRAKSAKGYYAAHGQIGWFVNGVAFAGDYLSAASFLGICGMIAFFGYDGFLYSIGYLAGWIVALFVIAEPIKRLGKFTFADALDSKFNSRGIKLTVAISTLVVSTFYLIPQMVGAGSLIQPLLGLKYSAGVLLVGVTVTLIVVTAGMVSTTWVQFIKGSLLVVFCFVLVLLILNRGLTTKRPSEAKIDQVAGPIRIGDVPYGKVANLSTPPPGWQVKPYWWLRDPSTGEVVPWRFVPHPTSQPGLFENETGWRAQALTVKKDGTRFVNGLPQGSGQGKADLFPVGSVEQLPDSVSETGSLGPASLLSTLQRSRVVTWQSEAVKYPDGSTTTVYYQRVISGADLLTPGGSPTFAGVRSNSLPKKLDFLSLMLALFCGTASLPHILIRYYTVKDQSAARKSTVVGIAAIGLFYVLTLYLGLGAMTSGQLDPTNNTMAAPLLAKSFSNTLFAIISAIAFTTVLGTVSGLIMAGSGAVAHDLLENFFKVAMDDRLKVFYGKCAAAAIGVVAMLLGIAFEKLNPSFLVGWAFNIAASANLPSLVMLLFWKRTTKQGITAAVAIGMISSLAWILLSAQCYKDVYGIDPARSPVPFSQPGLVTIPLGFIVLIVVSLMTRRTETAPRGFEVVRS
jgi:cation/acetate symporter